MTDDLDQHRNCTRECLLKLPPARVANRASRHKFAKGQLEELVRLLGGRCMLCLNCHAMVVDTTTRAAERRPRGVLCLFCKDRVAGYEGSYGDDAPLALGCRCRPRDTAGWEPRITAATAQYLDRTARLEHYRTNAERLAALIADVSAHGADPHQVWDGAPLADLPQLPAREAQPSHDYSDDPPLTRPRCANECREHAKPIYIACFEEPTQLRDSDADDIAIRHYVGWTRQHPPIRRVSQHGAICRESLVAIIPGSLAEEDSLKVNERCPKCGDPLWYGAARRRAT